MARILVADDEPSIREALELSLSRAGHAITTVADGDAAWRMLEAEKNFELAILDIVMPGLEGTAVLSRLRLSGSALPVIMLSSRDEELDRLGGFALGADDYVGKPFSLRELQARVDAVLRRSIPRHSVLRRDVAVPAIADGEGLIDNSAEHRAWYDGRELALTLIEFRLLSALVEHTRAALSREQLIELAWPPASFIEERVVDTHIKRLRKKLAEAGAPDELIRTIYGLGYRLEQPE